MMQFQKRCYANVELFRCGKKGHGLRALENIPRGSFIIEYVGEVRPFFGQVLLLENKLLLVCVLPRALSVEVPDKVKPDCLMRESQLSL